MFTLRVNREERWTADALSNVHVHVNNTKTKREYRIPMSVKVSYAFCPQNRRENLQVESEKEEYLK